MDSCSCRSLKNYQESNGKGVLTEGVNPEGNEMKGTIYNQGIRF